MLATRHVMHWIGGAEVESGTKGESRNPATGDVIGTYCDADVATASAAISAARKCFEQSSWRLDPMARATALNHLADAFEARVDDVIQLLTLENGKLDSEAGRETNHVSRGLRFSAGLAVQGYGRVLDPEPGKQAMSIRQPIGVAGLIIPWNSPVALSFRALNPALAAGCTVVMKMPAQSAQVAGLISE